MSRASDSIIGILLALSVAACGAEQASTSQQGGSAGSGLGGPGGSSAGGSGGTPAGNSGGNTGGTSLGSGGSPIGNQGGSTTGGSPTTNTGGSAAANSGGSPTGGSGGQPATTGGAPSGGSATAGSSATGGEATAGSPTLPAFVTSGPNAYWNTEGQVTELTGGNASLTVDENTTYQRWDGFGGTFNEMGWDALSVVSSEITNALRLLFDAQDGANFVYGRIPLGASDYSMSWYTLAETANDYTMENFSIDRDREMLIPYIKAAREIRPDLRLWASPWVVPDWMMDGQNMRSDEQTLEAHALYFAKFVEEYGNEGLEIEAVHPQNEPGYARVNWTQSLFIDFIKSYLGPKFDELGLTTEIWCGTMSHPDDGTIATTLADDTEAMQYVTGFGLQWNLEDTVATLAPKGPVMQTEHRCGNYSFSAPYWDQSRYDPNQPQNDHLYGEESWQLIRDWITAGVNSYLAWNMVLDSSGRSLDGWPQNALLVVDRSAQTLRATPAYYAFRHFSQYVAPGATRIAISGSNDAVAFENPDGSVITEVYNQGDTAMTTTLSVRGALYQFDVPAHGWATLRVP